MPKKVKDILGRRVNDYTGTLEYLVQWEGEDAEQRPSRNDCDPLFFPNGTLEPMTEQCRVDNIEEESRVDELELAVRRLHSCWTSRAVLLSIAPELVEAADEKEITKVDALLRRWWRSSHSSVRLCATSSSSSSPPRRNRPPPLPSSSSSPPLPMLHMTLEQGTNVVREGGMPIEDQAHPSRGDSFMVLQHDEEHEGKNNVRQVKVGREAPEEMGKMEKGKTEDPPSPLEGGSGSDSSLGPSVPRETTLTGEPCTNLFVRLDEHVQSRRGDASFSSSSRMVSSSVSPSQVSPAFTLNEVAVMRPPSPPPLERLHGIVWKSGGSSGGNGGSNGNALQRRDKGGAKVGPADITKISNSSPRGGGSITPSSSAGVQCDHDSLGHHSSTPVSTRPSHPFTSESFSSSPYVILLGDVILSDEATKEMNPSGSHQKKKKKKKKKTPSSSAAMMQCAVHGVEKEEEEEDGKGQRIRKRGETRAKRAMSIEELCSPAQKLEKDWRDIFSRSFLYSCALSSRATPLCDTFTYEFHSEEEKRSRKGKTGKMANISAGDPNGRGRGGGGGSGCGSVKCHSPSFDHCESPLLREDEGDEDAAGESDAEVTGGLSFSSCSPFATTTTTSTTAALHDHVFARALRRWVRILDVVPFSQSNHAAMHYHGPVSITSLVGVEEAERLKNRVNNAVYNGGTGGGGGGGSYAGGNNEGRAGKHHASSSHSSWTSERGNHIGSGVGSLFALKEEGAVVTELLREREHQLVVRCLLHSDLGIPFPSSSSLSVEEAACMGLRDVSGRTSNRKRERTKRGGRGTRKFRKRRPFNEGEGGRDEEEETFMKVEKDGHDDEDGDEGGDSDDDDTEEIGKGIRTERARKDDTTPCWRLVSIPLAVCRLAFPQLLIDYLLQHTLVLEVEN